MHLPKVFRFKYTSHSISVDLLHPSPFLPSFPSTGVRDFGAETKEHSLSD